MARELTTLLIQTAEEPAHALDTSALLTRVGRRQRIRRATVAGTSVCAVVLVVLVVVPLLRPPTVEFAPADGGGSPEIAEDGASQSSQTPEEAARDGVVPAIAALPFAERVAATEGTWVISTLPQPTRERALEDAGALGAFDDPAALDGRDAVSTEEYGEVLLLDAAEERILRAYPLPGVPPQTLVLADAAVYCARQGIGVLPDSMLCRIDRGTLERSVRVWPVNLDTGYGPATNRWIPPGWSVEPPGAVPAVFAELEVGSDTLRLSGPDGTASAELESLQLHVDPP